MAGVRVRCFLLAWWVVVVLTTTQDPGDIWRSYQLHTNAYLIKPAGFDRFIDAIRKIDEFFLALIQRPS